MGHDRHHPPRLRRLIAMASDPRPLTSDSMARLEYDRVRQRHVLLYPEGAVLLNETGAAILELCNGTRTVGQIVTILSERYHADVSEDVTEYLSQMADR